MDFDEYEYLERTVEGPDGTLKSNGADAKRLDDTSLRISKGQNGEYGNGEFKSKRMRSEERDRDHDERDRHQSREKDRVREKSRDRDRDRDRKRSSRDRDRERDRERDRLYDRERSRERSRDRERERSRDSGRSRELDPHRSRSRELDPHRDYERDRERERASRERREKREVSVPAEPEADPERDQRTVFAYQICLKADERDVYEFFSQAGKVRDVRLIMDRNSRRSKGVGYIEFYDALSVPMAIAMSGQTLLGQPVMVKPSEAEKNLVQSTTAAANGAGGYVGPYSGGARRLYVGNLHFNITEDQLRQVFEPFGPVELVQLPTDPETGHCKGFGFVQYQRLEDARAAQQALNGILELAGRVIKVSAVSDQFGMQDMGVNPGDLDDDEGGGLALNAHSRALLMQKLDRSGIATGAIGAVPNPATAPLGILGAAVVPGLTPMVSSLGAIHGMGLTPAVAAPIAESIGTPSEFLLLKNMFDPSAETEPDFDLDIKEDVQEECSKFGFVKHIFVDKNSPGHVYLRFNSLTAASNAQRALHGRWFAGKMITATFMTALAYEYKFPESR